MATSIPQKTLPDYLSPGLQIRIHHESGQLCATILPFSSSAHSTAHVVLVKLEDAPPNCSMQQGVPYIVKIFDPRFTRSKRRPWSPELEAAAARLHGGQLDFDPRQGPNTLDADYDEDPVAWERLLFLQTAWLHHSECLAYHHLGLAGLQGTAVPRFYGAGRLDLTGTTPERAIKPFVLFLEYIEDAVSLEAINPRRLTEPLLREIMDGGNLLKRHGVIHTDPNEANFLLVPAHDPKRVVTIDFAESWTRDAAVDEEDWQEALKEWNPVHDRRVVLRRKFQTAGLPVPEVLALPQA